MDAACLPEADYAPANQAGSGISVAYSVGDTALCISTKFPAEMSRREVRYGLETMCIGGGQGLAAIFGRV